MTKHCEIAARDFSKQTLRNLSKKGMTLIGISAVPDENGSFLNPTRLYQINDNGTWRGLFHAQVRAL